MMATKLPLGGSLQKNGKPQLPMIAIELPRDVVQKERKHQPLMVTMTMATKPPLGGSLPKNGKPQLPMMATKPPLGESLQTPPPSSASSNETVSTSRAVIDICKPPNPGPT